MNKYLVKIAAKSDPKTELEPGVMYNHRTKSVEPSRERVGRAYNRAENIDSGVLGASTSLWGAGLGALAGEAVGNKYVSNPRIQENLNRHYVKHGFRVPGTDFYRTTPRGKQKIERLGRFVETKTKDFKNKAVGVGIVLGALGLAAGGFGLGKAIGIQDHRKKEVREGLQTKLENKYTKKINEIEGWD